MEKEAPIIKEKVVKKEVHTTKKASTLTKKAAEKTFKKTNFIKKKKDEAFKSVDVLNECYILLNFLTNMASLIILIISIFLGINSILLTSFVVLMTLLAGRIILAVILITKKRSKQKTNKIKK